MVFLEIGRLYNEDAAKDLIYIVIMFWRCELNVYLILKK